MLDILKKELRLSAPALSLVFPLFGLLFLFPGYPVLCGAFFVTLGIYQSFRYAREANDIVFSVLLPIPKSSVVKGKYLFVCLMECCGFLLMTAAVVLRMTILSDAEIYRENALMNANLFALSMALLIYGLFNLVFVGGFFKTSYQLTKPFLSYIILCFSVIGLSEAAHHVPGLESVNAFGYDHIVLQMFLLAAGFVFYTIMTLYSCKKACSRFEKTDL